MIKPKIRDKIKSVGSTNRRKGHNYERTLVKEFKRIGYDKCTTSRYSSRILDDCKIDLNIPDFNIQAKNVRSNINYKEIFQDIESLLKEKLPERLEYISAIFHKRKNDEFVVLRKKDFYKLVLSYKT